MHCCGAFLYITIPGPLTVSKSGLIRLLQHRLRNNHLAPAVILGPLVPAMQRHAATVAEISRQVTAFHASKTPFRISHGSTNSTRLSTRQSNRVIDTSSLRHVLSINPATKTALVEPNVPMDKLVDATLKHGLIPPVVMEFPGITVGGGFAGTSGESSSFRHGFFDRTVQRVEMVLGDGEVVDVRRQEDGEEEKQDLLNGAAGALGTLGITTMVELRLKSVKAGMVETIYWPVGSVGEAVAKVRELTGEGQEWDYVDGVLFEKGHGVIVTGRLMDETPQEQKREIRTFTNARNQWFYLHAREVTSRNSKLPTTETIPIYDYLFRYDRGGFWVGASAFKYMLNFPFNRFTRWFLDDFLRTRMLYKALHASGYSKQYVVQDLALPYSTAEQFINYTIEKFNIWPLWLCPLKQSPQPTMHPHTTGPLKDDPQMLNIGLWGFGPSDPSEFTSLNRDLERKLKELGGMKWLYAQTYYSEAEFREMFDKQWYDTLREKYRATALPSVYDKVRIGVEAEEKAKMSLRRRILGVSPIGGLWGIWKAILSGEWRKVKRGSWDSIEAKDDAVKEQ